MLFRNDLIFSQGIDLPFYPLRPEFIESTYHLYLPTKGSILFTCR
jgi:hypothetical protein